MLSVIISTYNRPDALELVLREYGRITGVPFEVIVADDGSASATGELVRSLSTEVEYPLFHVRQEDRGFRLAAVRNLAARHARGEVFVFTDEDCIPFHDCLSVHLSTCRPGVACAGSRCLLTPEETAELIRVGRCSGDWFEMVRRREQAKLRTLWLKNCFYRFSRLKPRPKLTTANASVHRKDFERVNGFDERFEGWGYEDEDLARRLRRVGVRTADAVRRCLTLHLFHFVHHSHRPSGREGANRQYFCRDFYLTRPMRGLTRRRPSEVRVQLRGDVPESLRSGASCADPEVIIDFGPGSPSPAREGEVVLNVPKTHHFSSRDALYGFLETHLEAPFKNDP